MNKIKLKLFATNLCEAITVITRLKLTLENH